MIEFRFIADFRHVPIRSRCVGIIIAMLLLSLNVAAQADAQRKSIAPAKIAELVSKLRAPAFRERLQAEADCRDSGSEILPALQEALQSPDPELRRRAQILIEQIEVDELTRSIEVFLTPGSSSTLPGWSIVTELIEDRPEIRTAYAQVIKGNTPLAQALTDPSRLSTALHRQLQNIGQGQGIVQQGVTAPSTSAVILLLLHPDAKYSEDQAEAASRAIRLGAIQGVNETAAGQLLQALVTRWAITPQAGPAQDRLEIASRLSLPESAVPALELIQQKTNPHQLNSAFLAIAKHGGAAEMAIVETLLDDKFELNAGQRAENETSSTQLRDLALATLIAMTHQDPTKYGMKPFQLDPSKNVMNLSASFESETQRNEAFEKWHAWSGKNLRKYQALPANAEEGISL